MAFAIKQMDMTDDDELDNDGLNDDGDYDGGHHFGEDEEMDTQVDESSRPPQKRARDAKYAMPTMEEARLLRETEGKLFEGNLLRLEVEELLGEVRVDYGRKSVKATEEWLHLLKDALEEVAPTTVTEQSLDLAGIRLANHVPDKPVTLDFRPPEADGFDVAGSFLLRSVAKPSLNIDLALRIPTACLVPRDTLNHRYFDKRALYVGHLAKCVLDKEGRLGKLVDKAELSYFKGDPRKPVLLLHPTLPVGTKKGSPTKSEGKRAKSGFIVRLLPCCSREVMVPARLAPGRNNVRTRTVLAENAETEGGKEGEGLVSQLPPTPHYNSAILEDMGMKEHLAALHRVFGDSEAFRDAIIIGKVWLGQHGMRTSHDSMGGYEWSMLLLHLAQNRRVNGRMAALSIFQVALKFIAEAGLSSKCLTVETGDSASGGKNGLTLEEEQAFTEAFPANLVDVSLGLNVFARLSASAVLELEMTAKGDIAMLQRRPEIAFRRLFMTRCYLWRKCDAFVQVPITPTPRREQHVRGLSRHKRQSPASADEEGQHQQLLDEEEEGLLDRPLWGYVSDRVTNILREGLGNRCILARPLCGAAGDAATDFEGIPGPRGWHPTSAPPPFGVFNSSCNRDVDHGKRGGGRCRPMLTVGLIVDATFAGRLVDKGPPAEDGPAARRFREFWGNKSELRRFKDGSIVEAVVWTGKGAQRHRVVEQIVRHVLERHDPSRCGEKDGHQNSSAVRFRGNELLGMVAVSLSANGIEGRLEDDDLTRSAVKAFEKLQERTKSLAGMPLRVEALQAASPLLRYTSLVPPAPHPLATSPRCAGDVALSLPRKSPRITSQVEPMEVLVRLESSAKWPDELNAVRSTGTAFLVRLAQCLEKQYKLRCRIGRQCLDVMTSGYCFRLRVGGDRELSCLQHRKEMAVEALALKESVVLSAPHHSSMHGLHLQKPAFGLTVRAATRWLEEHLVSEHLRIEAVELLVASLFSDEAPLAPPSTGLAGFLRFLLLLAGHDWEAAPLVVDPQGELTATDREAAGEAFTRSRDRDANGGDAMFLVAPYSRDDGWASCWTRPRPERPVLGRLIALARTSADYLVEWLSSEGELGTHAGGWQSSFRMSAEEEQTFDVRLTLNEAVSSDAGMKSLSGNEMFERRRVKGCAALRIKAYKNLLGAGRKGTTEVDTAPDNLVLGFDPIGDLVAELRRRFGHLAVFFSPGPGGTSGQIGVIWRPSAFVPRPYNVNRTRHMMVFGGEGEVAGKGLGGVLTATNVVEVLSEMKAVGGDMVTGVHLS